MDINEMTNLGRAMEARAREIEDMMAPIQSALDSIEPSMTGAVASLSGLNPDLMVEAHLRARELEDFRLSAGMLDSINSEAIGRARDFEDMMVAQLPTIDMPDINPHLMDVTFERDARIETRAERMLELMEAHRGDSAEALRVSMEGREAIERIEGRLGTQEARLRKSQIIALGILIVGSFGLLLQLLLLAL